jgi:hypothetical protein
MKKTLPLLSLLLCTYLLVAQNPADTKAVGEGLLNGSIRYTGKNAALFTPVLDSLLCKNVHNRTFYHAVANKLQQQSDSSLNKQVASALNNYYLEAADRFADLSTLLTKTEINSWLDFIAMDFYADYKHEKKGLSMIRKKLKALEESYPNSAWRLKKYNEHLNTKVEELFKGN